METFFSRSLLRAFSKAIWNNDHEEKCVDKEVRSFTKFDTGRFMKKNNRFKYFFCNYDPLFEKKNDRAWF